MRRRDFFIMISGLASFWALASVIILIASATTAAAQEKRAKIGYLSWWPTSVKSLVDDFRDGMRQLGYVEGKSYEIEAHFTNGNRELTQQLARKFVDEPVDIILAQTTPAAHVVKEATRTIPIVMAPVANPLATGLIDSLARPGGNLTGVSSVLTELAGKRIGLLHDIRPGLRAVAFLGSAKDPNTATFVRETRAATDRLGIKLLDRLVEGPQEIVPELFDAMKRDGAEAIVIQPIFRGHQETILNSAMAAGLPVLADYSEFAEVGALLTYGANEHKLMFRVASYVDRILKGAKPAELAVEQPTEFEFTINLRTAKAIGWTIPQVVLVSADRVIE